MVPSGSEIGDYSLVGVCSTLPPTRHVGMNEAHFGSPSFKLDSIRKINMKDERMTYRPSTARYYGRALFELLVVPTPLFVLICFSYTIVTFMMEYVYSGAWGYCMLMLWLSSVLVAMASVLLIAAVKWLVMGKFVPSMHYQWSAYAITNEVFHKLLSGIAAPYLGGTPMIIWVLRLFGCKIGHGVYMNTYDIPEFDCVDIGDHCTINEVCLQTHTFEDRIGRIGRIRLERCIVLLIV